MTTEYSVSKLTKPSGINVHPGFNTVSATWDPVPDAVTYDITISGDGKTQTFTQREANIYIRSGLVHDTEYSIRIIAIRGEVQSPAYVGRFTTLADTTVKCTPDTPIKPGDPCYHEGHICVGEGCEGCKTDLECTTAYGEGYICDPENSCVIKPIIIPKPQTTSVVPIIAISVSLLVALLILLGLYFFLRHGRSRDPRLGMEYFV